MRTKELLKVLSSSSKAKIIFKLFEEKTNNTVTDLCIRFDLNQSNVSKHLMDLRKLGIVKFFKEGKESKYSLDKNFASENKTLIMAIMDSISEEEAAELS